MNDTRSEAAAVRDHLFALTTRGIKYDLERMYEAVSRCGNPHLAYPCFHVAGTNGKGSACAYIESVLRSHGLRTGLFTSPHIVHFEERFMINGRPIHENAWLDIYHEQQHIIEELQLTFFEATALIAFELFKREHVDYAIFEVGLGGRLDATNVVQPRVSVITRIAMDHAEYLGETLEAVASEKLGIVKKGVPVAMIEPVEPQIRELARQRFSDMDASGTFVNMTDAFLEDRGAEGIVFRWNGHDFSAPLAGRHQTQNAGVALCALGMAGFADTALLKTGIRCASLPGRFQTIAIQGKTFIFDVGHNPNAAAILSATLREHFGNEPICIVAGIMKDKDTTGILHEYQQIAHRLILTCPAIDRAADPADLASQLSRQLPGGCEIVTDVAQAVARAREVPEMVICVTGSFHTVAESLISLDIEPFDYAGE